MVIHKPKTALEATTLRHSIINSAYLAGGTEDLRLNTSIPEGAELIDINGLGFDDIFIRDKKLYIGARATLQDIKSSELVPDFIRQAASFCASFERRNAATVGGNVATRREDSYMIPSLLAANANILLECHEGEVEKTLSEYLSNHKCRGLLKYFVIDKDRHGWSKRFTLSSETHSALVAAHSGDTYALCVSGSNLKFGNTPDLYKDMEFKDDITGSAEYKKYLASIVFGLEGK